MGEKSRRRSLGGRMAVIALAGCGVVLGCVLGCAVALLEANHSLEDSAEAAAAEENAALAEARGVLQSMQGARAGNCSDAEIATFRQLVFGADYVKDAGRIRGGRIECSAMSGHPGRAAGPFKAEFRLKDGTLAYRDLSAMAIPGLRRAALRLGSAYVVMGMETAPAPGPIPTKMGISMEVRSAPQAEPAGTAGGTDPAYMTTEGSGLAGKTLYVTRCSDPAFSCVTATTTLAGVLRGESVAVSLFTVGGGILGIVWAIGLPFLFAGKGDMGRQLRRALELDQVEVRYQPIVDLETRDIVGAEALARWTDEDGNAVDPEVFVKVAEEQGFIGLITKTVLKAALRDFAATLRSRPGFRISINVGSDLVEPKFLPMLEGALERAKVRPESLVVEITERWAANGEPAKETIRLLRRLGHSIHIDDFGSGFSNLDKLLYLYADTIKIDKAFTRTIDTESVAAVILPHIMKIAKSLNLEVIVEGVEISRQADYFLPGKQKIYGQGFLFGRPMTAEAFLAQLAEGPMPEETAEEGFGAIGSKPAALGAASSLTA